MREKLPNQSARKHHGRVDITDGNSFYQEFNQVIKEMAARADIVCVQHTCLKAAVDFVYMVYSDKERQKSWGRRRVCYIHQARYSI